MKSKRSEIIQISSTPSSINNIVRIDEIKAKEKTQHITSILAEETVILTQNLLEMEKIKWEKKKKFIM